MAILAPFPAPLHLKSFIDVHISVHTLFTNPLPSPRCWEWMNSFLLCFFFFCSFPSLMWVLILGTKRINFNSRVSWPSHEWFSCRQTPDAISFDFSFSFYSSVQARGRLWGALCTLFSCCAQDFCLLFGPLAHLPGRKRLAVAFMVGWVVVYQ